MALLAVLIPGVSGHAFSGEFWPETMKPSPPYRVRCLREVEGAELIRTLSERKTREEAPLVFFYVRPYAMWAYYNI